MSFAAILATLLFSMTFVTESSAAVVAANNPFVANPVVMTVAPSVASKSDAAPFFRPAFNPFFRPAFNPFFRPAFNPFFRPAFNPFFRPAFNPFFDDDFGEFGFEEDD
jgi:hypothetical protein